MLDNIQSSFTSAFKKLSGKGKLSTADVEATLDDIRLALIDADVAVSVVDDFLNDIREQSSDIESSKSIKPAQQIIKIIASELETVLGKDVERPLARAKKDPTIYMLIGLQGAGKTTLAGKLGYHLKKNGHTPLLVAADLQRPGAVKQLEVVGKKAGVPVFAPNRGVDADVAESDKKSGLFGGLFGGKDASKEPVNVAKQAVDFASQKLYDTIIIDTAGRLGVDEELMSQAAAIKAAVSPDEVLFVLDSTTGQDAVNSARAFDEGVGFTGAVLTKFDSDTRGGAALSVTRITGKPILFSGVGELFEDLEVFHPDRVASRILDQGDILTLLEQAEDKLDADVAEAAAAKLIEGEDFDFNDFLAQMAQIKKMGSIKSLLGMIPGMGQHKKALENFDESSLVQIEAIVQSMTPYERANPKQFNGSRKARVAKGAGVEVSAVNQLLERFKQMQKMMRQMMGPGKKGKKTANPALPGGLPKGLPGGLPGGLANGAPTLGALPDLGGEGFDPSALSGGMLNDLAAGINMGMGAPGMANRSNSKRNAKNSKKSKGKSGNPAKRAAQEAALKAKFGG